MPNQPDVSIRATYAAVIALILVSIAMLLTGPFLIRHFMTRIGGGRIMGSGYEAYVLLYVLSYLCGACALALLAVMYRFLKRLAAHEVFTEINIHALHMMSRICLAAAILICPIGILYRLSFLMLAGGALFMTLIIRVIMHAFAEAYRMKQELDLTI